jgi:putative membrane protein
MDRRLLMAGLGAFAAAPALAQTQMQGTSGRATSLEMGQTEAQYLSDTLMKGTVSLETSRIATQKAQNPLVMRFARFEVEEQTTISEVLRSMMDPAATAGVQQGAGAMQGPDAPAMQALQQAPQGAAFDRQFIEAQVKGHQELLQLQERYVSEGRNREVSNVAKLARGHIREHLTMLQEIQGSLG